MDYGKILIKVNDELNKKYNMLKHDNNAHDLGVKGYEHVDVVANYYRMETLDEVIRLIDKFVEEA